MRILAVLVLIALALMHWVLPGQIEGSMNLVREHAPYAIRDDAQALHDTLFIADLHTDSLAVHPWTARTDQLPKNCRSYEAMIRALESAEVDGVFADQPDAALKLLGRP